MPNFNGTGPAEAGTMSGRGLGPCGSGQAARKGLGWAKDVDASGSGYGRRRCCGAGMGQGMGMRRGVGHRPDWFAVGYAGPGQGIGATAGSIRTTLENRKVQLGVQLAEIDALIGRMGSDEPGTGPLVPVPAAASGAVEK